MGSTLALSDGGGSVQSEYAYGAFGGTTGTGANNSNASQYTGRENDGTGLYFLRGRYYSPTLQRFLSEDPIGMTGGINLYAYVKNSPLNYIDPFGLDLWGVTAGVNGGVAVGGAGIVGTASYMIGYNDHDSDGERVSIGGAGSAGFHAGESYSYPKSRDGGGGLGAAFGAGAGFFWSNANSFSDLAGPFDTTIINTPFGVGLEIDNSGPIYVVSLTYGKGFGAGIFHLKTNTPKGSTWETKCTSAKNLYGPGSPGSFAP